VKNVAGMSDDLIGEAERVLRRAIEPLQPQRRQRLVGFDAYFQMLLVDGHLPGETSVFPNRALTIELFRDMQARCRGLRFVAANKLGAYFARARFVTLWRHVKGNGWSFGPLIDLREDWGRRYEVSWPDSREDWTWSPARLNKGLSVSSRSVTTSDNT
jgi:hypothetical protein